MGIDVKSAYAKKEELYGCASSLRDAKSKLDLYKGIFGMSWQGEEIPYYLTAIDKIKQEMDSAISELESIGSSIVTVANQIKKEEEEELKKKEEEERAKREAAEKEKQAASSGGGKR